MKRTDYGKHIVSIKQLLKKILLKTKSGTHRRGYINAEREILTVFEYRRIRYYLKKAENTVTIEMLHPPPGSFKGLTFGNTVIGLAQQT
jgi:hypothetical protein